VVKADLTAIVTPGYQFPLDGSVAPSYSLLNLLGSPTIAIYGTVGGSNTLAAGSVTGVQLNSSVADAVTIGFNGNNPPGLQVLGQGVAGPGLTNNGTTGLTLWVDTNLFSLATNSPVNTNSWWQTPALTLFTNSLTGGLLRTNAGIVPGQMSITSGYLVTGGPMGYTTNGLLQTNGQATMIGTGLTVSNATYNYYRTNADASVTTVTVTGPVLQASAAVAAICKFSGTFSGSAVLDGSKVLRTYNVVGVTNNGGNYWTVGFATPFANTNYVVMWNLDYATGPHGNGDAIYQQQNTRAATNYVGLQLNGWGYTAPNWVHLMIVP